MDEISAQLGAAALNSGNDTDVSFQGLYKNWGKLGNQERRRKDLLKVQRSNRDTEVDVCRGILNYITEDPGNNNKAKVRYRPSIYVAGFNEVPSTYKNVLMMSEWMIEKPEYFEEDWYVVPCPKGTRSLAVAAQGITKFFTKYGSFKLSCRTALPGGNPCEYNSSTQCVVLDGFLVEATNTFYILDLLAWNNHPMSNGETEFRHYWMKTHIEDIPALTSISKKNKILFEILPKIDCNRDSFNKFMMKLDHFNGSVPSLDGLLFYHKMAHYVSGVTPLVGWLYPFMVNEVLGSEITVNPGYMLGRPDDYIDQNNFIRNFDSRTRKKIHNAEKQTMDILEDAREAREFMEQEHQRNDSDAITDAEMNEGVEPKGWQPTTTTISWPQQTDTAKHSKENKVRTFPETMD